MGRSGPETRRAYYHRGSRQTTAGLPPPPPSREMREFFQTQPRRRNRALQSPGPMSHRPSALLGLLHRVWGIYWEEKIGELPQQTASLPLFPISVAMLSWVCSREGRIGSTKLVIQFLNLFICAQSIGT
jgi:hypothetical protein